MTFCRRYCRPGLLMALVLAAACHEKSTIEVASLSLQGMKAVKEGDLKAVLATRQSSKLPWGEKYYFDRARLQADIDRIQAFYADRGYPDARVSSFDVKLNQTQDKADITIVISEGEPIIVDEVRLAGFEQVHHEHLDALRNSLPLRAGQPRDRQLVQVSRDMAVNELRDHGHAYARVTESEQPASTDRHVIVTLTATPGPVAFFGPIEITGNSSVGDNVIRRQLTYKPGELFQVGKLQESQRRLYGLELFQFATIEPVGIEQEPTEIPTRVTVTEGKHRKFTFGVGYGTEEKGRAQVEWRHVNFLGGARTAQVNAKWSSLDRGVRIGMIEPYFLAPNLSLTLNGQQWYSNEPAYTLNSRGGRATVTRRTVNRGPLARDQIVNTVSASLIDEFEQYTITPEALLDPKFRDDLIALRLDPRTGFGRGTLTAVALDANRNTTKNLLDAKSGYLASIHLEQAGRVLPGSFDYLELTGEARHYLTVARRFVLANRVRTGSIDELHRSSAPFFKRYFLGGSTSLRGWGRYEVSPLSGSGLPIGGLTMFEASSEVRVPLVGNFAGVVFVDAGNVWPGSWDVNLGDLLYAAGPGLRYNTPIGPIRFDVGYQLTQIEGLLINGKPERRHWRIHFSIGQAF